MLPLIPPAQICRDRSENSGCPKRPDLAAARLATANADSVRLSKPPNAGRACVPVGSGLSAATSTARPSGIAEARAIAPRGYARCKAINSSKTDGFSCGSLASSRHRCENRRTCRPVEIGPVAHQNCSTACRLRVSLLPKTRTSFRSAVPSGSRITLARAGALARIVSAVGHISRPRSARSVSVMMDRAPATMLASCASGPPPLLTPIYDNGHYLQSRPICRVPKGPSANWVPAVSPRAPATDGPVH